MGLFGKGGGSGHDTQAQAIAAVVKAERLKTHKDETTWRFILLVKTDGGQQFGAMVEQKVPNSAGAPQQWKRVPVVYDPNSKERAGRETAVDLSRLASVDLTEPIPTEVRVGGHVLTAGPRWIVPHECPKCGGVVDEAKESMVADPKCTFCREPLPVQPAPAAAGIPGITILRQQQGT